MAIRNINQIFGELKTKYIERQVVQIKIVTVINVVILFPQRELNTVKTIAETGSARIKTIQIGYTPLAKMLNKTNKIVATNQTKTNESIVIKSLLFFNIAGI